MYVSLAAWSTACLLVSGTFDASLDNVNLLQQRLAQSGGSEILHSKGGKGSKGSKGGKGDEGGDEGCLDAGDGGKGGKTGKGKGGKGDSCQQCAAAEAFCQETIDYVTGCQEHWSSRGDSCSKAFCNVQQAMQEYRSEREVFVRHYDDATALRGACKQIVREVQWGPASAPRTCPTADRVTNACINPSTAGNIADLEMATFCDELDYMCDAWALWFIEAAGRQDEDSRRIDGDRYSCKLFAAYNAWAWAEAPGGCAGGVPNADSWTNRGMAHKMADTEWMDEEDEVDTIDTKFQVVRGQRVAADNTLQWMLLSIKFGCEGDRQFVKAFEVFGSQNKKRQDCFQQCQQLKWCMSVDIGRGDDSTCKLFDWDCESPTKQGRESWRLHRGDSGVSKSTGGRLGCTQEGYQLATGSGKKWDCPSSLQQYTDSTHGCLLPDGPLAQCVCDYYQDCGGIATVYQSSFRQIHGSKKKLVGVGGGDSTEAYTCQKAPYTAPGCGESEALIGNRDEGYRGCQDTTESGKRCRQWTQEEIRKNPLKGLGPHNHCRNPDGGRTIWCMIDEKNWGYCQPKALTQLLEITSVSEEEKGRVAAASDELSARASAGANLSGAMEDYLDEAVSRKGCHENC